MASRYEQSRASQRPLDQRTRTPGNNKYEPFLATLSCSAAFTEDQCGRRAE